MKRFALAALLLTLATVSLAEPFPKLACYHGGSSTGAPFILAGGALNDTLIRQTARYQLVTLNPNACLLRPDLPARFRYFNPKIKLLFYHPGTNWHLDSTFVVNANDTTFYAEEQRALQWSHGWVPGAAAYSGFPKDWKQQDVADTLIRLWVKVTKQARPDGWFFDHFNPIASNAFGITDDDDRNRLYHMRRLVDSLRTALPGILLFANGPGTLGADLCRLDGGMNESFPNSLTPFATAIMQKPNSWLKSESPVGTSGNATLAAYTLGVACLTGAYANHGNSHYTGAPEEGSWWFPFYSVDPNGVADPTGRYTGWLGEPLGPMSHLASAQWRRQFEHGCVVVNTGGTAASIPLGGTYKLIGSSSGVTSTTVPAGTAVFLWK